MKQPRLARPFPFFLFLLFSFLLLNFFLSPTSFAVSITEFDVPTAASGPDRITTGADGNLWFLEVDGEKVGVSTTAGSMMDFDLATTANGGGITAGPDGNVWFTEFNGLEIGKITPADMLTEIAFPGSGRPSSITTGSDGNLWITDVNNGQIWQLNPNGTFNPTPFDIPTANGSPTSIISGPDGNLWFTEFNGNKIGKMSTAGSFQEFDLPATGGNPWEITVGPDGNLWFVELNANFVGRISTAGDIQMFAVPSAGEGIAAGPDGNLWITEAALNKIGQITPSGVVQDFDVPTANSVPSGITLGPDGNLWFTEFNGNKLGVLVTSGALQFSSLTYSVNEAGVQATIEVDRVGGSDGPVTVDFATSDGTAMAPLDYTATSGTLSFGPGETSKTFVIPIVDDNTVESSETVNLTLSNPTGGATLGTPSQAVLTITDNDVIPAVINISGGGCQLDASHPGGTRIALIPLMGLTLVLLGFRIRRL